MKIFIMKKHTGFTLVELIVVITILAVLGSLAFVSFQWYAKKSRDAVRLSDIQTIKKAIEYNSITTGNFIDATDTTQISYNGIWLWQQWVFWKSTIEKIWSMTEVPLDPSADIPYAYSVTDNKLEFQIAGIFEWSTAYNHISEVMADSSLWAQALVVGQYNGRTLYKKEWSISYIFAIPSLILNDVSQNDIQQLSQNDSFVFANLSNLPANYSTSKYSVISPQTLHWVDANYIVSYSWSMTQLLTQSSEQDVLIDNLQKAYSGSIVQNRALIQRLYTGNINQPGWKKNMVIELITNSFAVDLEEISKFLNK